MENIRKVIIEKYKVKIAILISLLLISTCIGGCKNQVEPNGSSLTNINQEENKKMIEQKINGNKIGDNNKESELKFYGVWKIVEVLGGTISALSQEEAEKIIGERIVCFPQYCDIGGAKIDDPYYKVETSLFSEFREGWHIDDDWGVNSNIKDVQEITIYEHKDDQKEWDWKLAGFGGVMYFIDSHMIVYIEGSFFKLKKVNTHDGNKINKYLVQEGQTIAGLEVKSVERDGAYVNDILFTGELTLTGSYEWDETLDGIGCLFTLDKECKTKIPVFEHLSDDFIRLNSTNGIEKLLPPDKGSATIVIDNYSIGERDIVISADLVKIIKLGGK